MRFARWLDRLRKTPQRLHARTARKHGDPRPIVAEVLESRDLLTNVMAVDDSYQTVFGQALVADGSAVPTVTDVQSILVGDGIEQVQYSDQFGLLFLRDAGNRITIVDTVTELVAERHVATNRFTDMDLTPDGRYLFAADYGEENSGYGTARYPHYVHRYDLVNRTWEVHRTSGVVFSIEALDTDRYAAQGRGQSGSMKLNAFGPNGGTTTELSSSGYLPIGDFEYAQSGRILHGTLIERYEWPQLIAIQIVGDRLVEAEESDVSLSRNYNGFGGSNVLSSDARRYYFGQLQVDAENLRNNLLTFEEIIYAATPQIAFGNGNYFDAVTGTRLGQLGFATKLYAVSGDGTHVWAYDASAGQLHHLLVGPQAVGVLANDGASVGTTAELVTGPTNGQLVLQPDGRFRYTPNFSSSKFGSIIDHDVRR